MGQVCAKLCSKRPKTNPLLPMGNFEESKEMEMKFGFYKSTLDGFFKRAEENYNLLKYFQVYEFLLLLSYVKVEAENIQDNTGAQLGGGMTEIRTNANQHNYFQEVNKMEFLLFINNKIMKNFLVVSLINEGEENSAIFKDFMSEIYDSLIFATIDYFKSKNPGKKLKKGSIKSVKKLFLFGLPLLYCSASNNAKVNLFFDLFSQEGRFTRSDFLKDFLFYLFILPSTLAFRAVKNLGEKYPNKFERIASAEYLEKSDAFEVQDIFRLIDIFYEEFFTTKEFLTKADFDNNFIKNDFGWIFSPNGIRSKLEVHNDVKIEVKLSSSMEK